MFKSIILFFCLSAIYQSTTAQTSPLLWYNKPATKWTEGLLIGNGRLAAMIYTDSVSEIIQVNEESVWGGKNYNDNNPLAKSSLPEIREMLFKDSNQAATDLANKTLLSVLNEGSTTPAAGFRSYQNLMNIHLHFSDTSEAKEYKRQLNLFSGVITTTYQKGANTLQEEYFASANANLIFVRVSSLKNLPVNFSITVKRPSENGDEPVKDASVKFIQPDILMLEGQIIDDSTDKRGPSGAHMKFAGAVKITAPGGALKNYNDSVVITNASSVVLIINGATNYDFESLDFSDNISPSNQCLDVINRIQPVNFEELKTQHIADFSDYMKRVDFNLNGTKPDTIATDVRLQMVKEGKQDDHLTEVYFQYGRYLLLSSSRKPGLLPANLQGKWNHHIEAPWDSDYHTNINLQMNYWPADVCNLSETFTPYVNLINKLEKPGTLTAKQMYGCKGWTMHHCTDIFGKTTLQNAVWWGTFPMATAWVLSDFYNHFLFTRDNQFLRQRVYPLMKGHAVFIEDFLVKSPEGYLVTSPSYSPENSFIHPVTGKPVSLTYGATMDIQIIRDFLKHCVAAATVLNVDGESIKKWSNILQQLPPTRTTSDGRIMEWIKEYKEAEPGHRHISHLYAVHPANEINEQSPDLLEAAKKTLAFRLQHGGGHTGWSRAWIINFYARFKMGDTALHHLNKLFEKSTHPNLLDDHPPFQIDGNFGATAGIAEMLLQSQNNYIELLPALPARWQSGYIKGLKARGNYEVEMHWNNGKLVNATVKSITGKPVEVKYGEQKKVIQFKTANAISEVSF